MSRCLERNPKLAIPQQVLSGPCPACEPSRVPRQLVPAGVLRETVNKPHLLPLRALWPHLLLFKRNPHV